MTNLDSILKSRDITLLTKVRWVKAMVFPVVMYGCESWTMKKAEWQKIDVFELWCWRKLLSPLDSKEFKLVNPRGNQPWIFTGNTDTEAEAPILWPPDAKSQLIGKDSDSGEDWGQENGTTEDEMVGWHHWHNRHEWSCLNSGRYWRTGKPGTLQYMGVTKSWTWLSYWTTTNAGFTE